VEYQIFEVVFLVWGIAVAIKAVRALQSGQPYVFSMWDGGMLRSGRSLTRFGTQMKVVTAGSIALGCGVMLAVAVIPAAYVVIVAAVASIVFDLVTTAPKDA
jgi:hypothetical protein